VKILAILGDEKDKREPSIPTSADLGLDKVKMSGTRGFVIQSDAPDEVKSVLEKLMADVAADPEFEETLTKSNQTMVYKDGPAYEAFMKNLQKEMEVLYEKEPW